MLGVFFEGILKLIFLGVVVNGWNVVWLFIWY